MIQTYVTHTRSGISLIELSITLLLIMVLVTISVPRLQFFQKIIAKAELEKITSCFMYLQQKAIAQNKPETLKFDTKNKLYYTSKRREILTNAAQFDLLPQIYGPPSQPKQLLTKPITFHNDEVIFYPKGSISSGSLYLTNQNKNTLLALTCAVGTIGTIKLYIYDHGWKLLP